MSTRVNYLQGADRLCVTEPREKARARNVHSLRQPARPADELKRTSVARQQDDAFINYLFIQPLEGHAGPPPPQLKLF